MREVEHIEGQFLPVIRIGVVQRAALDDVIFGWLVMAFVVAGNTGLNLAFGITGAKLDWTDPRRMTSGGSGCLAALPGFGFQGLSVALLLRPAFLESPFHRLFSDRLP